MSSLTWMDFSEEERRQALDLIDQLNEPETRDELGIGTVRDALAELLFPGTSTIQTRAKYFLFIPWIYLDIERRQVSSDKVSKEARNMEVKLIEALLSSEDLDGVIGREARAALKRLPSSVYWQGLHRLGLRLFQGSQDPYHRSLNSLYAMRRKKVAVNDDREILQDIHLNWHAAIPPKPPDFPIKASFKLTSEEAGYLRERILHTVPKSMFAFLVREEKIFERTDFPWELTDQEKMPAYLINQLRHAQTFSQTIHGAALMYNLMLAEQVQSKDLIEDYRERLTEWWDNLKSRQEEIILWDRPDFWKTVFLQGARIPIPTQSFINDWLDIVITGLAMKQPATSITEDSRVRLLIKNRELKLKRGKARLGQPKTAQLWTGESGSGQLNYRWSTARRIVIDIVNALKETEDHA